MDDLISRQATIDALDEIRHALWEIDIPSPTVPEYIEHHEQIQSVWKLLDKKQKELYVLPSAQPERKRGKWIERNPQNSDKCRLIECDQCGFSHIVGFNVPYEHWIENRNFCERCGADMREEKDERPD